jgi:uncharacterized protein (TIGR02246 family)
MNRILLVGAIVFVVASGPNVFAQGPASDQAQSGKSNAPVSKDEAAIRQGAKDYAQAFAKKDAKALAAMWTENGQFEDDQGVSLHGKSAIENAYADMFKDKPAGRIDVQIQSIRFLTPDVALEEGILHEGSAGRELPTTSRYSAVDVRDGGQWKIAYCRDWGSAQDHLDDLNWLAGKWKGSGKDGETTLSFTWDEKQPILVAKISSTSKGKPAQSGTIKIGYDPRRGGIHSWHGDADGSQSQAQWERDGNRWIIHTAGLTADGKKTSGEFILTRIDDNDLTWRCVERTVDDRSAPDMPPIKLTREAK